MRNLTTRARMPVTGVITVMHKLWVLPFADTGTCLDDTDGWLMLHVESESAAFDWCCNHTGLIEIAEFGIDRARIVSDGKINFNA